MVIRGESGVSNGRAYSRYYGIEEGYMWFSHFYPKQIGAKLNSFQHSEMSRSLSGQDDRTEEDTPALTSLDLRRPYRRGTERYAYVTCHTPRHPFPNKKGDATFGGHV
ncbi:hypothetical protein AMTR_s00180p00028060 [Amborella trichopoda]|uniref:Uncharacterized protein n=1 Tax=Amborella trichopoda TaxID=13333 RepID=W1PX84_AMBTC|nr:hypothetical protein AMTR_s00180p00028060 [Amborella trichopoda]